MQCHTGRSLVCVIDGPERVRTVAESVVRPGMDNVSISKTPCSNMTGWGLQHKKIIERQRKR